MAADPVFVDTNILVHAGRPLSPDSQSATTTLARLQGEGRTLWISPQVLREYLAVVSRPQANAPALPMRDALADARRLADLFNLADEGGEVMDRLFGLLSNYPVAGKQVHDAHLVATMLGAGIRSLLTFNGRDFERFGNLIRLEPIASVAAGR